LPRSSRKAARKSDQTEFARVLQNGYSGPDSIARAIAYAIEQPAEVEIDEVVIPSTAQDF
jgi:NADP-dependent 3-hydroxy acid dehydrogenase YdfG